MEQFACACQYRALVLFCEELNFAIQKDGRQTLLRVFDSETGNLGKSFFSLARGLRRVCSSVHRLDVSLKARELLVVLISLLLASFDGLLQLADLEDEVLLLYFSSLRIWNARE